jgi:predicted sulfurtransferase
MRLINTTASLLLALVLISVGAPAQQSGSVAMSRPAQNQVPGDGARRITPAEVRAALDNGEAIMVDVRSEAAYGEGHVKGARLIPISELTSRISELPRDKMIITYCS